MKDEVEYPDSEWWSTRREKIRKTKKGQFKTEAHPSIKKSNEIRNLRKRRHMEQ